MNARGTTASLVLLLALASGQAQAAAPRPLQLGFTAPPAPRAAPANPIRPMPAPRRPGNAPGFGRNLRTDASEARLRERAVQSLLDPQEPAFEDDGGAGRLQLHFHKRGSAFRDLNKSYREMCNKVSAKIWDEPNGKRVRFDVAGKPGVGFEIPLH